MTKRRTAVTATDGRQELLITREFDLPVDLLYTAYTEPDLLSLWMGTTVVKLDNHAHGGWRFRTTDAAGTVLFEAHGTIHDIRPNTRIVRTFEMMDAGLDPQLEFLEFAPLTDATSRLTMHIVYRSVEIRDRMLQFGMAQGMNLAHNRLQDVALERMGGRHA